VTQKIITNQQIKMLQKKGSVISVDKFIPHATNEPLWDTHKKSLKINTISEERRQERERRSKKVKLMISGSVIASN